MSNVFLMKDEMDDAGLEWIDNLELSESADLDEEYEDEDEEDEDENFVVDVVTPLYVQDEANVGELPA